MSVGFEWEVGDEDEACDVETRRKSCLLYDCTYPRVLPPARRVFVPYFYVTPRERAAEAQREAEYKKRRQLEVARQAMPKRLEFREEDWALSSSDVE